ncbi:hypothetical protein [Maridesulfovibrio sp.]|uniref:hypothetical protein n=1 Tax=Maridesulfovibrio sp. TaxID=2795000 RepID=UPI000E93E5A3|nr:hypothetical protein [Maridesulfovibrio sp.]HAS88252.1 hypothetical protein [Desulfovibrio sp.]
MPIVKAEFSEKDSRGFLFVDCWECTKGRNGNKSCSAGWKNKKGGQGGCFCGILMPGLEVK